MRILRGLALVPLLVGCHLDQLVNGGGAGPAPSGNPPAALAFTAQPSNAMQDSAITPPVQVTAYDSLGNKAVDFNGSIRLALGTDGSATKNARLGGATSAPAVAGVASFADLRIDQVGVGYTLTAAFGGAAPVATSATFDITPGPPPPPTTGSLTVTTATTGASPDPDGYTVTVDGTTSSGIGVNESVTFNGLAAGNHSVMLSGIAGNCTVSGGTSRTVSVTAGQTTTTTFSVSCPTPPPTTGSLTVTTATSGSNLDPDGYSVAVSGASSQSIGVDASVTFTNLSAGSHTVTLSGVAANCSVSGGNSQTANVPAGGTAQATFAVSCAAPPNQPPVAAFTSSCSQLTCSFTSTSSDPDGSITSYAWTFGDGGISTARNPSHTYSTGATYTVTLTVTDNQSATDNVSHTVTVSPPPPPNQPPSVTAGEDQRVLVGALFTLSGAGFSDPDHDGPWTVTIDWGDGTSDTGTATSEGSIGGSHSYPVTLLPHDYQLTVTVVDAHGARGSATKTVHVVLL